MVRLSRAVVLLFACACATTPRTTSPHAPSTSPAREQVSKLAELHPVNPAPPRAPIQTLSRVTLGAVGDVLMHGAVKDCAAAHRPAVGSSTAELQGYDWLYRQVADLLSQPDLTFANLETPIAPLAGKGSRSFVFNAPTAAVKALAHSGVDIVTIANNHIFDQGREGFLETLSQLDTIKMPYVGAGRVPDEAGPKRLTVQGFSIEFFAWSRFFNQSGNDCPPTARGQPCVRAALLDPDKAVEAVRVAATRADAVVVSLHWGDEYQQQPRAADVDLAHRLADAGALLILGHHPHVLQPLELYQRADGKVAVIAYSLGNFISNQSRNFLPGVTSPKVAATRDSALLRVSIARRDYGGGVTQVEISGADYLPLWTENDTVELNRRKHPKARPTIQVVSLDRALAEVQTELTTIPTPVPEPQRQRFLKLRQREQLYQDRLEAIGELLGEELRAEAPLLSPAPVAAPTGASAK